MQIALFLEWCLMQVSSAYHDYWTALWNPQFHRPYLLLLLLPMLALGFMWGKRQVAIMHSTLAPHKKMTSSWSLFVILAYACLSLCLFNLDVAMMGPKLTESRVERLVQTRNVCVLNDSSGSMKTVLNDGVKELGDDEAKSGNDPGAVTVDSRGSDKTFVRGKNADEPPHPLTRAEAAQLAARYLVRHRMSVDPDNTDRFCLMRFDDDLYMMAPLTNDKLVVLLRTAHITENVGGGTNFVNALQRVYDYFTLYSRKASVRVAIVNTDGYDSIDPEKRKELIALFKEAHIKLYIIGLGEGWKEGNTLDLQKFADELRKEDPHSGLVFRAANPGEMQKAMQKIDELEKAQEVIESTPVYREADYIFILGALGFAMLFFGFATLAGRNP